MRQFKKNIQTKRVIKVMHYIKCFETIEEYESWMSIEENANAVYDSEEKILVDGVIISHTNKEFEE